MSDHDLCSAIKKNGTCLHDDHDRTEVWFYHGKVYTLHYNRREVFSHITTNNDPSYEKMARDLRIK